MDEVTLSNGWTVDSRCYDALQQMMDACRAEGMYPVVCSAYRTQAMQQALFDQMKQSLLDQGYSDADAETEAGRQVAVPAPASISWGWRWTSWIWTTSCWTRVRSRRRCSSGL